MKQPLVILAILLLAPQAALHATEGALIYSSSGAQQVGSWDLTELKRAPAMRWLAQSEPVHSLLYAGETFTGTDTEVFADRTAVTGISWGGYTTCLVASLDDRFTAAVPVYDCGFLHEGESVQKPSIDALGEKRDAWVKAYDPSRLLPHCRVPILWVNGTGDEIRLAFESAVPVKSATLHYTTDPGLRSNREWKSLPARIGEVVTSTVQFQP